MFGPERAILLGLGIVLGVMFRQRHNPEPPFQPFRLKGRLSLEEQANLRDLATRLKAQGEEFAHVRVPE